MCFCSFSILFNGTDLRKHVQFLLPNLIRANLDVSFFFAEFIRLCRSTVSRSNCRRRHFVSLNFNFKDEHEIILNNVESTKCIWYLLNLEPRFDLINWFRYRWPSGLIDWCTSKRTSKWRVPNIWREREIHAFKNKKKTADKKKT